MPEFVSEREFELVVKATDEKLDRIEGMVEKIFSRLEGNGKPGILRDITTIQAQVGELQRAKRFAVNGLMAVVVKLLPWMIAAIGAGYGLGVTK